MKNGRINERNCGNYTLDGELKSRRTKTPKLTTEEFEFVQKVLDRVVSCLEYDKDMSEHGHLHPESKWTDGGRFLIMMDGKDRDLLWDIAYNRKK